jgi:hypothetical protein
MRRLLTALTCLMAAAIAGRAVAQNSSYILYLQNFYSAPAGVNGLNLTGYAENDNSGTANFKVCFYTGYGSTASIPLSSYTNNGNGYNPISFSVPASTIQSIPPTAFSSGVFNATLYTVDPSIATCSGGTQAGANSSLFPIYLPQLTSVSLASVPATNPNLTTRIPSTINLVGANFLTQTIYGSNSTVTLTDGTTFTPTAAFLSGSSIAVALPLNLPATGTQIALQVCNNTTFCSAVVNVPITSLQANPGTAAATPNPATPTQPVTLSASFGSSTPTVAGAAGGLVTFKEGTTTLATAPLILATTAKWVQAPATQFTIQPSSYANSFTADFNHDGIPDVLVVDPGVLGNYTGSDYVYPMLHVLLGTTPSGSFAGDVDTTISGGYGACDLILSTAVADFNGDGYPDIATLCTAGGTEYLYTFAGLGDGNFNPSPVAFVPQAPIYAGRIVAGDFNGDGKQDLALVGSLDDNFDGGIQFLPGDGTGTFSSGTSSTGLRTSTNSDNLYYQVVAADFNGDGYPDIAVMNGVNGDGAPSNSVEFFANDKSGGFALQNQTIPAVAANQPQLVVGRLNATALPSVIVAYASGDPTGFTTSPNSGGTTIAFNPSVTTAVSGLVQLVVGDFTGKGILDVAAVQGVDAGYQQLLLHGDGTGNFANSYPSLVIAPGVDNQPYLVAASDQNGDGLADLLTLNIPLNGDGGYVTNDDGSINDTLQASITAGSVTASTAAAVFPAGTHTIVASTPGTYQIVGGSATTNFVVSLPVPTVTLAASPVSTAVYGTSVVLTSILGAATATGSVAFYDGTTLLGSAPLVAGPASATAVYTPATLSAGTHSFTANYVGDTNFAPNTSAPLSYVVSKATPVVSWAPNPSTVTAGTALTSAELDATSATPGTFTYTPALGSVLNTVGTQTLSVLFTPTDAANYSTVTQTTSITVVPGLGLAFTPNSIDFGNQTYHTTSAPQSVTLSNPNTNTIDISQILVEAGADPLDFAETDNCPPSLVQNASCTLTFTFTPRGVGTRSAGLVVNDDDPTKPTQGLPLTGTGTGGILQVDPGNLKTLAGSGAAGYTGDGEAATAATLNGPGGVAFDPAGNLYIADVFNAVVRKVDTAGTITTFAGTGTAGYTGDGGPATDATLKNPFSVASDAAGNIYIQDSGNNVIRKVDATTGVITTFAGTGTPGHLGDGGPATAARFNDNQGARFDKAGNLYVPQCSGASVRRIDAATGIITTVAGNFTGGFSGDGGLATDAQLQCPSAVTIDPTGVLYIADFYNNRIRKVDTNGIISTIAGDGNSAFSGDGGPATAAELSLPNDVLLDSVGNLYIADNGNNRIRKIDTSGIITTVAGGFQSAGSAAANSPAALAFDPAGNLVFSDTGNNAIRQYAPAGTSPFPATPVGTAAAPQTLTLSNIGNLPVTIASADSFTLGGNAADFSLTGGTCLSGATLAASTGSCTLQIGFTPTAAGNRSLTVSIADNALNSPQSFSIGGAATPGTPVITWAAPAAIAYGTALSATQLDATVTDATGAVLAGSTLYTPPAGTILTAGTHSLTALFKPTDNVDYSAVSKTVDIVVGQATPTLTWPTPSNLVAGSALTATQLDATAAGYDGATLPGSFTYTPPAGTTVNGGSQTLSVLFTPNDLVDYTTATASVTLNVDAVTLTGLSTTTATLGDLAKTITLTGTGFRSDATARANGAVIPTTFVSSTGLTAIVPASAFLAVGPVKIDVYETTENQTTAALTITVTAPTAAATVTGPSTVLPNSQPALAFQLGSAYPVDIVATFILGFTPAPGLPDDPLIKFTNGLRTFAVTIPANTTTLPAIQFQGGTVAGTLSVTLALTLTPEAGGVDITPTTLQPLVILAPSTVPGATSTTVTRDGQVLTVVIRGFSNTRELSQIKLHFTPASGEELETEDFTLPAGPLFIPWFSSTESLLYGSEFTYTQVFNLSADATVVGKVSVTLVNSQGSSPEAITQ